MRTRLLLFAGVLAAAIFAQWEPLGTLHCAEGEPIWAHVIAHLEGRDAVRGLDVWVCPEDYEAMRR